MSEHFSCNFLADGYLESKTGPKRVNAPTPEASLRDLFNHIGFAPVEWLDSPGALLFIQPEQANNENNQNTGHNRGQDTRKLVQHILCLPDDRGGSAVVFLYMPSDKAFQGVFQTFPP
jgi:hypothetical protein